MQHRFSSAIVTACMFGGWVSCSAPVVAQHAQPSVSVVTFDGTGAPRDARDAMADELAARLVDTGHFRVLHREWLPHESDQVPALEVLRAAAQSVNVDYLVLGTIRQSTNTPAPRSRVMQARGFGPSVGGQVVLPMRPMPPPRGRQQMTIVIDVRVIDVMTADVVRTAAAQRVYSSNGKPSAAFLLLSTPMVSGPVRLAAAIATLATRSKSRSVQLTKEWRQAVQEVALQLDARGVPASGRR